MKTKVEGILIRKTPYKDRHLIGELLLRSGRKVSVIFYGGQGGGKKQKSTVLEIGHLISVELGRSRSTQQLQQAKEWRATWTHESIRLNHQAFYLMCAYCELMQKIADEEALHDKNQDFDRAHEGLFKVLSNGLFYLDKRALVRSLDLHSEFMIFVGKLLIDLGVFPVRDTCVFCGEDVTEDESLFLMADHGGFSCRDCFDKANEQLQHGVKRGIDNGRELWGFLGVVANQRYQDLNDLKCQDRALADQLFHFLCYQFQWSKSDFKSISMIL